MSSDLRQKRGGGFYAGDVAAHLANPGVAIYFHHNGSPKVFACDQYTTPLANIRAIALSIQAIRSLERWGTSGIIDRALSAFVALPDKTEQPTDYRSVLGLQPGDDFAMAKRRYFDILLKAAVHPDRGGSGKDAAAIIAAWAEYEKETANGPR